MIVFMVMISPYTIMERGANNLLNGTHFISTRLSDLEAKAEGLSLRLVCSISEL